MKKTRTGKNLIPWKAKGELMLSVFAKENHKINLKEFLKAFEELETLYPRILPMTMWRAWELATYRHFQLHEPVLDLGCGDGRFFRQIWPNAKKITGVDIDSASLERAKLSGVYQRLHLAPAHQIPEEDETFNAVFSNCAMEHMSHIELVIKDSWRVLKPGGVFLFSVVTDHLLSWAPLPQFLTALGMPERGEKLTAEYIEYHHLVNPLSAVDWGKLLLQNGFQIKKHIPIVPDTFARAFLVMDQLWHVPYHTSEIGEPLHGYLHTLPNFLDGVKDIVTGLWKLSPQNEQGAGAIFLAQKGK
jgi:ubiquinone/menaquinone biosynthesis C-methylase UbiE